MTNPTTVGKYDGPGPDPNIACNMQGSGLFTALVSHRYINPVVIVASTQKKNIFTHHEVIINSYNPIQGFEIPSQPDFIADGEVLSIPEICTFFNNEFLAFVSIILLEQLPT